MKEAEEKESSPSSKSPPEGGTEETGVPENKEPKPKARRALSAKEKETLVSKLRTRAEKNNARSNRIAQREMIKTRLIKEASGLTVGPAKKRKLSISVPQPLVLDQKRDKGQSPIEAPPPHKLEYVTPHKEHKIDLLGDYKQVICPSTFINGFLAAVKQGSTHEWVLRELVKLPKFSRRVFHLWHGNLYPRDLAPIGIPITSREAYMNSPVGQAIPAALLKATTSRITVATSLTRQEVEDLNDQSDARRIPIIKIKNGKVTEVDKQPLEHIVTQIQQNVLPSSHPLNQAAKGTSTLPKPLQVPPPTTSTSMTKKSTQGPSETNSTPTCSMLLQSQNKPGTSGSTEAILSEEVKVVNNENGLQGYTRIKIMLDPPRMIQMASMILKEGAVNINGFILDLEGEVNDGIMSKTKITSVYINPARLAKSTPLLDNTYCKTTLMRPEGPETVAETYPIFPPRYIFSTIITSRPWPLFHYTTAGVPITERDACILQTAALFRVPPHRISTKVHHAGAATGARSAKDFILCHTIQIEMPWSKIVANAEYNKLKAPTNWYKSMPLLEECYLDAMGAEVFGTIDYATLRSRNPKDRVPVQQWDEICHPNKQNQVLLKYSPWTSMENRVTHSAPIDTDSMEICYPLQSNQNWVPPPDKERAVAHALIKWADMERARKAIQV